MTETKTEKPATEITEDEQRRRLHLAERLIESQECGYLYGCTKCGRGLVLLHNGELVDGAQGGQHVCTPFEEKKPKKGKR